MKNSITMILLYLCLLTSTAIYADGEVSKSDRILIALIITFTLSTALAGYHFGIENGVFDEYTGCTNTNIDITNKEKIIESLGMVKNCKDVDFTILGISLSGLNFLTSLLIVLFSLRALVYEKD